MIHVSIQYNKYRRYNQLSDCIITGEAFYRDNLYKGNEFIQLISSCETEEQFIDRLKRLNGFYALIKHSSQKLFAAVDRVRSIPLFYGQKGNDLFLSDSAEWVREQVGNNEMDTLAREEFLLTGYVTGPDTLFPDVKQLQAGEALIVSDNNRELSISVKRYYRFIHQNTLEASEDELLSKLDKVLINVFKRLIKRADGQTLVVPLSGGYDSRLIVLMLKRLGYDNVITFSYGRLGNKESEISKKVAETLGMRWEFIPYSNEAWYKWFHSEERKKYWSTADGLCTLAHIQDWPAVWEMKRQGVIPSNAIYVPGHTVTLTLIGSPKEQGQKTLTDAIKKKHYSLKLYDMTAKEIHKMLEDKINSLIFQPVIKTNNSINIFESWECQERQSKFIINSVRVYEFWGYQWWLPLWDTEFIKLWSRIALDYRLDKKIYRKYVDQLYTQLTGADRSLAVANTKPFTNKLAHRLYNMLQATPFYAPVKLLHNYYNKRTLSEYDNHPLAAWGRYAKDKKEFSLTYSRQDIVSVNSVNTKIYIEELSTK
jgi:asparagine synthase (glutamine-hydrolysing)